MKFLLIQLSHKKAMTKKSNLYEKNGQQSLSMAVSQEGSYQFQNYFSSLVLNLKASSESDFKSIGPSQRVWLQDLTE